MPFYVGSTSGSGTGTELRSDRIGIPVSSSNPSSPAAGDIYFNTSDGKIRLYNGSTWANV
jgi:hypothetical protein